MAIFPRIFGAVVDTSMIDARRKMGPQRAPTRDLKGEAIRMYSVEGRMIHDRDEIEAIIMEGLRKGLRGSNARKLLVIENDELLMVKKISEDLHKAIQDTVAIAQLVLEGLMKIISENQKLRAKYPQWKPLHDEEARIQYAQQEFRVMLEKVGSDLLKIAK